MLSSLISDNTIRHNITVAQHTILRMPFPQCYDVVCPDIGTQLTAVMRKISLNSISIGKSNSGISWRSFDIFGSLGTYLSSNKTTLQYKHCISTPHEEYMFSITPYIRNHKCYVVYVLGLGYKWLEITLIRVHVKATILGIKIWHHGLGSKYSGWTASIQWLLIPMAT